MVGGEGGGGKLRFVEPAVLLNSVRSGEDSSSSALAAEFGRGVIIRYQEVCIVPDILIRDVPDDVVAAIDAKAQRAGLSRTEYLRRALSRERKDAASDVTVEDLTRFARTFTDLADSEVMGRAWR